MEDIETKFTSKAGNILLVGLNQNGENLYLSLPKHNVGGITLTNEMAEKLIVELAYLIRLRTTR